MSRTRGKQFTVGTMVAALALFGAACGDDDGGNASDDAGDQDVEAPEGRDDQDPGFDDLQAGEDFGAGGGEDEATDDEEETDEDEEADDEEETDGDEESDDDQAPPEEYEDYVEVEDDSGTLTISVPEEWSDVDTGVQPTAEGGEVSGVGIAASPDLDAYTEFYDAPGVVLFADVEKDGGATGDELDELLRGLNGEVYADGCTFDDTYEYDDGFYTGSFDIYENCGGDEEAGAVVLFASAPDDEYYIVMSGQVLGDADLTALDEIVVSSFYSP